MAFFNEEEIQENKSSVAKELGIVTSSSTLEESLKSFRNIPENAIPIAPSIGKKFKKRFDEGYKVLKNNIHENWRESIKEFTKNTDETLDYAHENLVKTTIETLVDFSYMRDPSAEITGYEEADKDFAKGLTNALSTLINKRNNFGINLRQHVIKQIVYSHLTNFGVIKLGFQGQKGSQEEVAEIFGKVQEEIKKKENSDKAGRLYELLDILQKELETRRTFGFTIDNVNPFNLVIDPKCEDTNLSSARWLMEIIGLNKDFIKAEYMTYNSEEKSYHFIYDSTKEYKAAEIKNDLTSVQEQIINDVMPELDDDTAKLKVKDDIPCVIVYDKVTKLRYLYLRNNWVTPLWVFEDELQLSRFFPYYILPFSTPLTSIVQKSEVTHYIGFQRAINAINKQLASARRMAFNLILFNKGSIDIDEVDKILKEANSSSNKLRAIGVKLKDNEGDLQKMLAPFRLPSTGLNELFDTRLLRQGAQAASRVSETLQGQQFRTNTTNDAIDTYKDYAQTRFENITDKIEYNVEEILWSICEIIVSKFSKIQLTNIVKQGDVEHFKQMTVIEFNQKFNLSIAAGSTEKPTSQNKKKEAIQIIQMLGQFGSAAPGTVLKIVSGLLRSAFSKALVTDDALDMLDQEAQANLQKGVSTPQQKVEQ